MTPVFEWDKEQVQIIKACWASDAGRHALALIVQDLAGIHASSFSTDPLQMAFNEGRRFVARELSAAINLPVEKIAREPHEPRSNRPISATERAERAANGERPGRR